MAVALLAEQFDGSEHHRVAAASVGEPAVAVVGRAVAVERDPDPDVELVEEVEVTGAELDAVGVDPEVQLSDAVQSRAELLADPSQSRGPRQERFPTVQDHCDGGKRMSRRMLGQAPGSPGNRLVRDGFGACQPALVGMFIDITMITGQIAPAVHFQHEFTEGDQGSCHPLILAASDVGSESRIERGDPGGPGRCRTAYAVDLPGGLGAANVGRREGRAGLRRGEGGGGSVGLHGRPRGILKGVCFRTLKRCRNTCHHTSRHAHFTTAEALPHAAWSSLDTWFRKSKHAVRSAARVSGARAAEPAGRNADFAAMRPSQVRASRHRRDGSHRCRARAPRGSRTAGAGRPRRNSGSPVHQPLPRKAVFRPCDAHTVRDGFVALAHGARDQRPGARCVGPLGAPRREHARRPGHSRWPLPARRWSRPPQWAATHFCFSPVEQPCHSAAM